MEPQFKYAAVWQRAKIKLKLRRVLGGMRTELHLFGSVQTENSKYATKCEWRLNPESQVLVWWQGLVLLIIYYAAVTIPLRSSFFRNDGFDAWALSDLGVSLVFICDLGFAANVKKEENAPRWEMPWTLLDIAACIPGEALFLDPVYEWLHLCKLYRLLRISRVLKMSQTPTEYRLSTKLKDIFHLNQTQLQLVLCLLALCVCIHIVACLFYLTAVLSDFRTETWVVRDLELDDPPKRLYIAALYWTVTTFATVGYGDISCFTNLERVLGICWMVSSVYFFSFTLSSLTSMFMSVETRQNVLLEKLALLDEFAKEAKLTSTVKLKIRNAIQYSSSQTVFSWSANQDLFQELPKHLREEVALAMHKGAAKEIPFFSERPKEFMAATVPFLQNLHKALGDLVIKEGEYADEIYFLSHGRVNFVVGEQNFVYKTMHEGTYFGDIEVLKQVPRKYVTIAAMDCNLLVMRKEVLSLVRRNFPGAWTEMMEVAEMREKFNDKALAEAKSLLLLQKSGNFVANPQVIRSKLIELQSATDEKPEIENLNDRMQAVQSRYAALTDNMKETKANLSILLELVTHVQSRSLTPPLS